MTLILEKGRYRARECRDTQDVTAAQSLRALAFGCDDRDALDAICTHILIEDRASSEVLCCFRMMLMDAVRIDQCYSSQFYDLSALKNYQAPMVELGRFCTHPEYPLDPDLLRVAWGAITAFVDAHAVELMFGCSSFAGTDPDPYLDCFALLNERHLASNDYMPAVKGNDVFSFSGLQDHKPDVAQAMRTMPPLLRSYLMMGGWVSDHAIVDHVMTTLHVFTGVEVRAIPDARKRLLRAVVG